MTYLLDVNVWLALSFQSHQHHELANQWFLATDETASFAFCRLTQQGFLRLATHPHVGGTGGQAMTLRDAWQMYDRILEDPRVNIASEPSDIESRWRQLTQAAMYSPKVWNDAFLAAFAQVNGYEVVTLDQGFAQYSNLQVTILK